MPRKPTRRAPVPLWGHRTFPSVTITPATGEPFDCSLRLRQWSSANASWPHDWEQLLYHGGIAHRLDLVVDDLSLEIDASDAEAGDDDEFFESRWQTLAALPGAHEVRTPSFVGDDPSEDSHDRALLFARLGVTEFPDFVRAACHESWLSALDAQGSELGEVFESAMHGLPDGLSCFPSTLYWFRRLDVHPAVQGHGLGAALIAHALRLLVRDEMRVAIAEVMPCKGLFSTKSTREPNKSRAAQQRLARYYTRAGFKRWRGGYSAGSHPILWFAGEWHPDPAEELACPKE